MKFDDYAIRLVRHIGQKWSPALNAMLDIEHDQKVVMIWCPSDIVRVLELGILPDKTGAKLLWNPFRKEEIDEAPGFADWIEKRADAEKKAGRFYDRWQDSDPKLETASNGNGTTGATEGG